MPTSSKPILLYDGVCGLCNRLVRFTLGHDRQNLFRFASLQSSFAAEILQRHAISPEGMNTVYIVLDYQQPPERLLARSEAVAFILEKLGSYWVLWGRLCSLFPRRLRDASYNLVATNRYKIFGKFDTCPLPDPQHRHKFLDQ